MQKSNEYPQFACQFCGSHRKFVETIIDDEFIWNQNDKRYQPNKFSDTFEHTGEERCAECKRDWTGLRENA